MKINKSGLKDGTATRNELKLKITKTKALKIIEEKAQECRHYLPCSEEVEFKEEPLNDRCYLFWVIDEYDNSRLHCSSSIGLVDDAIRLRITAKYMFSDCDRFTLMDVLIPLEELEHYSLFERKVVV